MGHNILVIYITIMQSTGGIKCTCVENHTSHGEKWTFKKTTFANWNKEQQWGIDLMTWIHVGPYNIRPCSTLWKVDSWFSQTFVTWTKFLADEVWTQDLQPHLWSFNASHIHLSYTRDTLLTNMHTKENLGQYDSYSRIFTCSLHCWRA